MASSSYRVLQQVVYLPKQLNEVILQASLVRWNKKYDGSKESLTPKSHKSHSPHPNAHTETELKWIKGYHRRNPDISINELYGKL